MTFDVLVTERAERELNEATELCSRFKNRPSLS